jgi:hypothetical protein
MFQNETASFQLAFCIEQSAEPVRLKVIKEHNERLNVHVRRVCSVPVVMPAYGDSDDNYLRKTAGLYPDRL